MGLAVAVVIVSGIERLGDELGREWSSMYGCFEGDGWSIAGYFGLRLRVNVR